MKANIFKEKYLLFKAKSKDPQAFSEVYDLYADRIYRFIFFKVNSREEAQDLTAEVFLKTWQYIIDGKEIKNLNAFFYKIAKNLVIDHYRKASQQKEIPIERADLEQKALEFDGLKQIESRVGLEKIEVKLKQLKAEYREIILLKYIEDLSISEIAQIMEKKKGAVRVMLFRALNALKELMEE